jgi:hypothetical protein
MSKLLKLLKTLDENLIKILLVVFIFLIPLYPKFPLKNINFTYIAVRLEDLYLALMIAIFFVQLLRKKIALNQLFLKPILFFWLIVFLSFLSGTYLTKTIVYPQLGLLHFLRRIEYVIVFFIAASSIKSKNDFKLLFSSLLLSLFLVNLYGLGQRFLGFPAVSTMNPEFARGHLLYLTPEARLASTFAGHYDLATYLVFLIPIVWGFHFTLKKSRLKIIFLAIFSLIILVYTASRISFIAYIISTPLLLMFLKKYRYFIFVLIISILLTLFSRDLTQRFLKTVQIRQILVNELTGQIYVPQKITTKELPAGSLVVKLKKEKKQTTESALFKENLLWEATQSGKLSASDAASLSDQIKPVSALAYDISFATRLQVEWPRAIKAFLKNPLLGTGPSSITESTDNDYLRWLGEFGLLGFCSFLAIILLIIRFVFFKIKKLQKNLHPLFYGLIFANFGLLLNASYIDVFEASKVAYVFWYTLGIFVGVLSLKKAIKIL